MGTVGEIQQPKAEKRSSYWKPMLNSVQRYTQKYTKSSYKLNLVEVDVRGDLSTSALLKPS